MSTPPIIIIANKLKLIYGFALACYHRFPPALPPPIACSAACSCLVFKMDGGWNQSKWTKEMVFLFRFSGVFFFWLIDVSKLFCWLKYLQRVG